MEIIPAYLLLPNFLFFFFPVFQKAYSIDHEPPPKQQCVKNGRHPNGRGEFVPLRLPSDSEDNGALWEARLTSEWLFRPITACQCVRGCNGPVVEALNHQLLPDSLKRSTAVCSGYSAGNETRWRAGDELNWHRVSEFICFMSVFKLS